MELSLILSFLFVCIASIIIAMKICFASKCQSIHICWGLIEVSRMVGIESTEFHSDVIKKDESTQKQIGLDKTLEDFEHSLNGVEMMLDRV